MDADLVLYKTDAYKATITTDDKGINSVTQGYYKNSTTAELSVQGKSFYGSNGRVHKVNIWSDLNGVLYEVEKVADGFEEDLQNKKDELLESIKNKLTPAEIKFLDI